MTPRENFLHFFRDEPYEWIPSNNDLLKFQPVVYADDKARGLVSQQVMIPREEFGGPDSFGVEWKYDPQAGGSMEVRPLLDDIDDLLEWEDKVVIPDPKKWDWEKVRAENSEYLNTDKLIYTSIFTGFFERLISLVGFEDAAVALIDDEYQDAVKAFFDRIADYYIDLAYCFNKYCNVEMFEVHDDWGTQRGLMFSRETHHEMIFPYIKKVVDGIHTLGLIYEQHSCGLIEDLMPDMIASGADTWRGQDVVDKKKMVDLYGNKFKFCVNIPDAGPEADEENMTAVKNALELYKDKRVWFFLDRYSEEHKKMAEGLFHANA